MTKFYSNGKLLITGEYAVLDGAKALAIPTKYGQSLELERTANNFISWKSLDEKNKIWFETNFRIEREKLLYDTSNKDSEVESISLKLREILQTAHTMNPDIFSGNKGYNVITRLDFPRNWGLGSSSTLINNIAKWFQIDAFNLLKKTFGGSGYDIAAAQHKTPITYQLSPKGISVLNANFNPGFKDKLFFVHLKRKQNSRDSIAHYRNQPEHNIRDIINKVSALTEQIISCENFLEFETLLDIHETVISKALNTPKIKLSLFPDYHGALKSLGGWGGDFILATGGKQEQEYFRNKNYHTIIPYLEMLLSQNQQENRVS